jgi:hypothetical protein
MHWLRKVQQQNLIIALANYVLGINHVIRANHMISLLNGPLEFCEIVTVIARM